MCAERPRVCEIQTVFLDYVCLFLCVPACCTAWPAASVSEASKTQAVSALLLPWEDQDTQGAFLHVCECGYCDTGLLCARFVAYTQGL